jgi:FkbM family methyltransferase
MGSIVRRLDPLRDPEYVWKLNEPFQGMRFRVVDPSERQYVSAPYEPAVVAAIRSVVRSGMTCIDAGAHIGYMTLLMAHEVGRDGHVFAFEPSSENCGRLRTNLALNAVENATVVQAVVSSTAGAATLGSGPSSFEHHLDVSSTQASVVESVTLDAYFVDKRVDFVKLDVEGAEELAVKGMYAVLARDKPTLLIEDHGAPTTAAKAILASLSYLFTDVDSAHVLAKPTG